MKKIISYLSTKTLLGFMLLISLSIQNTTNIKYPLTASANAEVVLEVPASQISTSETVTEEKTELITNPQLPNALIIKAINPGYTVDGTRDVGEFIELQNTTDASLPLAGYSLRYINSSGKQTTLLNFSEGSSMVGEFLLLRLARTANSSEAEMVYTTTLAMSNARLEVLYHDEVVDQVCWSKNAECAAVFDSKQPSTLVRNAAGAFEHVYETYSPHYDAAHPTLQLPPEPEETSSDDLEPEAQPLSTCRGLEFTEVLTYYAEDVSEQFIELYNATDQTLNLEGCALSYKKKFYPLTGEILADSYFVVYPSQFTPSFSLTKNPSSSNSIELLDKDGTALDILVYLHGQKKSTAYAKFIDLDGSESWDFTYATTPGATNIYQEFRTCPAGKVINPATGNCIKITAAASSTVAECPAGKYRNPLTGRCKNIETASEPKPCAEGYERNPETNRCRKIKAENDGAGYALVPTTYTNKSTFVAFGIVALLVSAGVVYIILQFRREIARAARKARQRFHHIRKDLIARGISFHRHK